MATIRRLTVTRWVVPHPVNKGQWQQVPAGSLGATKRTEETECYYIVDKSGGKTQRVNTDCTDYRAAQAALTKYHQNQERGEQGLTDPHKPHLDKAISDHIADYVQAVADKGRSVEYVAKLKAELANITTAAKIDQLRDLTAAKVSDYLSALKVKATTRNKHRTYLYSLCDWLVKRDRLATNPITRVDTFDTRTTTKRKRRSLTPKQLRTLVSAVASYPLAAKSVNKGGRPRRDGTRPAPSVAKLTEDTVAQLTAEGRERQLWYRVAVATGLRRGELSRVTVGMFKHKRQLLDIPAAVTKNRRAAIVQLPPQLAADLRQWVQDTARRTEDKLFALPDAATVCLMHQRHLRHANIPYQTDAGFADWHAMRKTANTFLRRRGVSLRLRQRFLRHTAPDLATSRYDDERANEMRPVVKLLAKLDKYISTTPA